MFYAHLYTGIEFHALDGGSLLRMLYYFLKIYFSPQTCLYPKAKYLVPEYSLNC